MANDGPSPKKGRPRTEPGAAVGTWLRAAEHDKLVQLAKTHDMSVSALVRALLKRKLHR